MSEMRDLFKNRKILIVDDEEQIRSLLMDMLGRIEPSVKLREAGDGRRAIELALADPPDVITLDLQMPEVDGYAVLRELRSNPKTEKIPIAVLTGRGGRHTQAEVVRSGADAFLEKPVSPLHIMATIAGLMRIKIHYDEYEAQLLVFRRKFGVLSRELYESLGDEKAAALLNAAGIGEDDLDFG